MIIVINSQGGLVAQQDEELHQGSSRFNTINLIAPFSTNVMFWANFELPDGTIKPSLQGALMTPSVETPFGVNTWKLHMNFPLTQYSGQVKMQLRGMIGDVVACTTTIKFYVEKGVPYQSEELQPETYDYIMTFIEDLRARLVDKVNINHNTFVVDTSVTDTSVGQWFVYEDGEYKSKTLPQEYEAGTTYYKIATTGTIGNNDNGLYLQMSDGTQTTKLEVLKDKVVINGKTIVIVDDLIAENIAYDNTESGLEAENVQDAIDEVEARTDDLETRMTTAENDIDSLEANKEDKSNKVSSWSVSPNNTRYPSEKLVKDNLDLKEDEANKTNIISDNSTQYASAKAVFDYAENKSNKVSSITIASTNIQYPTAKAVYDGLILKEDKSNKVIAITQNSTDTQYPSAKAVFELVVGYSGELKIEFVEELPQASAETWFTNSHTFYFKSVEGEEGNVYEEYVCRKVSEGVYAWEMIGSAQVDLSNYYTKSETDVLLGGKEDKANKVTEWSSTTSDTNYPSEKLVKDSLDEKSSVSVSTTGTATTEGKYLIVDGTEYKLGGGVPLRRLSYPAILYDTGTQNVKMTWQQLQDGDYLILNSGTLSAGTNVQSLSGDLVLGSGVTTIDEDTFFNCTNLTSITISNSVTTIGEQSFQNCVITSITIPNSVTSIGMGAFVYCSHLTSVTFEDGCQLTTIPESCFDGCSLTSIEIPHSVTTIGIQAFQNNDLTSVEIPNSVTSIERNAFYGCSDLANITFEENSQLTSIGNNAFNNIAITSITIPNSVTSLGDGVFDGCANLVSATISNNVTSFSARLFWNCTSLENVTIPNGVTTIGAHAFDSCTSLTSLTIPVSVTSIGAEPFAFSGIRELNYTGTIAQWGDITLDLYWRGSVRTIHCSDGDIDL